MNKAFFSLVIVTALTLAACAPSSARFATAEPPMPTLAPPTSTAITPKATPTPQGRTLLVTSAADSGPGTLRQAMLDAQNGDTITFDPSVFPPDGPVTISVISGLPQITQGNLTIDASNAGVILDGSNATSDWLAGLEILSSENTIRGMQISNFSGPGIAIAGDAQNNIIGGDRSIGAGPFGQGNMLALNDNGIVLSTPGTSLNTITGNLIGTDAEGTESFGNRLGVWITEGAHSNIVGPDNVIAHSSEHGILLDDPETVRNTITQNSIHNNLLTDIELWESGNTELAAPIFFDLDLKAGILTGAACANCTVEIFSDKSDEGAIYEGQITADDTGAFSFDKGVPFIGPHLTSTATDLDGNTSGFSLPTSGTSGTLSLQLENDLPLTLLSPKPSQELLDNHIGVHYEGYERYVDTEHVFTNGFKWVRIQSLTEFWGEGFDIKTFTLDSIPPSVDKVISEYADNDMNIVLDLWLGAGLPNIGTTFQSEEEVNRFSDYVQFIVSHFKGRIGYYEIWNEPGGIAVHDYANLVRQVVPIIREEDPEARIIIGAIPGDWINGYPGYGKYQRFNVNIVYLNELLRSGVAPLVDGISWHPFYDNIPSDPYYQDYPQMLKDIKELAFSQGFTGEYFADELLWRTVTEEGWDGGPPLSPLVAAKQYVRGILMHRGLGINVTIITGFQTSFLSPIHNLNDTLAGAEPTDISLSLVSDATNIQQYAFSMPKGDKLVAMWVNGDLVEDDPGIPSTLTFPGTSAQKVIGIDVLHGFEQELIIEMEDGNLVIRNLLIKDYPIILRLVD